MPHTLYSYRRCPYAMRARMALVSAGIDCLVHEINFWDKPQAMLEASPKGTVPVLIQEGGGVIDESLDIVLWALAHNDPDGLKRCDEEEALKLIVSNDGAFKRALDRYKYPGRFPDEDCSGAREQGLEFLENLNSRLEHNSFLMGDRISFADICVFPFIRQFAHVDKAWFEALPLQPLQKWLAYNLQSDLFQHIMVKHKNSPYPLL